MYRKYEVVYLKTWTGVTSMRSRTIHAKSLEEAKSLANTMRRNHERVYSVTQEEK